MNLSSSSLSNFYNLGSLKATTQLNLFSNLSTNKISKFGHIFLKDQFSSQSFNTNNQNLKTQSPLFNVNKKQEITIENLKNMSNITNFNVQNNDESSHFTSYHTKTSPLFTIAYTKNFFDSSHLDFTKTTKEYFSTSRPQSRLKLSTSNLNSNNFVTQYLLRKKQEDLDINTDLREKLIQLGKFLFNNK